jgi:hypothetical protein
MTPMSMKLESVERMLHEVARLHMPPREVNIFSIGGRGHYEGEHGLGDLLLSSLVKFLPDPPLLPLELEEPPDREFRTKGENRIDILLKGSSWVIAVENKLRHLTVNPFAEYRDAIIKAFSAKRPYFVILATPSAIDRRCSYPTFVVFVPMLLIPRRQVRRSTVFVVAKAVPLAAAPYRASGLVLC